MRDTFPREQLRERIRIPLCDIIVIYLFLVGLCILPNWVRNGTFYSVSDSNLIDYTKRKGDWNEISPPAIIDFFFCLIKKEPYVIMLKRTEMNDGLASKAKKFFSSC